VSDQGSDFRPPPPRREPRRFEPPPWEKAQFEKHAREQAERERAEREARAAAQESAPDEGAAGEADGAVADASSETAAGVSAGLVNRSEPEGQSAASKTRAAEEQLDDSQIEMLMLNLRAEESERLGTVWVVGLTAGVVVGLVGTATVVWGTAALLNRKLGQIGTNGGMVLVVFGLSFIVIGGWAIYRSLRQRGVL